MQFRTERVVAGLCVISFLLSLLATLTQFDAYLAFFEAHLSPDGVISKPVGFFVRLNIALLGITVFALLLGIHDRFREQVAADFSANGGRASWLCALVFALAASQQLFNGTYLYREDGLLETATAVLALAAASLLLAHAIATRDRVHRAFLFFLSFGFFLFGMEEISWGQRLWAWATPEPWADLNFQQETNLHNLLNPAFTFLYCGFNLFMAAVLFWGKRASPLLRLDRIACLLPGTSLMHFGYVFLFLAAQCILCGGEVTEDVFSVFGISYAFSLWNGRTGREATQVAGLRQREDSTF